MPEYCRVEESDEGNNASGLSSVPLPQDSAPTVTIRTPGADSGEYEDRYYADSYDDAVGLWYKRIPLLGDATDPEDGTLSGSSLVWTTDRTDMQAATLGTGRSIGPRLYMETMCTGQGQDGDWHVITLTATDSAGNQSTAVRRIFVWGYCLY